MTFSLRESFLGRAARNYPISTFIIFAIAWTWGYGSFALLYLDTPVLIVEIGTVPAIWGPLLAAAAVIWLNGGDLRAWVMQVTNWRVHPAWYLIAILLPFAFTELSAAIYVLAGIPIEYGGLTPWWHYIAGFLIIFLTMGALEEFGWRGFAQPILQDRYTAVHASLFIGFVWAVWHYYLFVHGVPQFQDTNILLYTARLMTASLIYAWIYNATGGGVLFVMMFHAAGNLAAIFQPAETPPAWVELIASTPSLIAVQILIGLILIRRYGSKYLAKTPPEIDSGTLLNR